MEVELKELKSTLRSLVVSSAATVDVRSLQRDYRNMMGGPIPIAKYGYRDVLAFLKERCDDCFLFQGLPSNPVLTLIVPESLKHIDQFVRSQKTTSITKMKGKRRSVPDPASQKENLICQTFNSKHGSTKPACTAPPAPRAHVPSHHLNNNNDMQPSNNTTTTKSTGNLKTTSDIQSTRELNQMQSNNDVRDNGHEANLREFFKKRLPMYESKLCLDSEACSDVDKVSGDDSGRLTSSSHSSTKKAQLEELKEEIFELIKEHENGILSTDLMKLYRQRYSRELQLSRFGFHNINGLLAALQERVRATPEAGAARLQDARAPPAPRPRPAPPAPRPAPRAPPPDPDDALPGIDFDPDVFPADCLHYMESIPPLALGDVGPGAMLEVIVAEVYSPSHFWLQRLGAAHNLALDAVMDEMAAYYRAPAGAGRVLARAALRPGQYCSSLYERDWHRSLVVKVLDADTVKVRHVDYGTVDTVAASSLKPLLRRWAALPAQAVRAQLAGLRPGAGGRRWPHAAAAHFLNLVRDRRLVANVVAVDPEEDTLETFLIDTSGPDDVCLSTELIRAGHADARADSALRAADRYLFPRFGALESGDTPNFAEIHRYLADGISLEYVEAYRRHVPAALPSPPASPAPPRLGPCPAPPPAAPAPEPGSPVVAPPAAAPPPAAPPAPAPPAPAPPTPAHNVAWQAAGAPCISLSLQEVNMYTLLSSLDPEAAHCYMMSAVRRANTAAGARRLNPLAPEFRAGLPPPPPAFLPPPPPAFLPPPPRFPPPWAARGPPPPGF